MSRWASIFGLGLLSLTACSPASRHEGPSQARGHEELARPPAEDGSTGLVPRALDPLSWTVQHTDPNSARSVSVSEDSVLVAGSPAEPYVFTWDAAGFSKQTLATGTTSSNLDVGLSGDHAIVGAYAENAYAGAAYLFTRTLGTWGAAQRITASDGGARFGRSVAIDGNTAVLGAEADDNYRGAVYVFVRSGDSWVEQQKLVNPTAETALGWYVAIDGDTILAGAVGSAVVFTRSGTTWSFQARLTAADAGSSASFGESVAISGDTAVVGAYQQDGNRGAAYVFERSGLTWGMPQKLVASDVKANDYFAQAVWVEGDTIAVRAVTGGLYLYARSGGTFGGETKLTHGMSAPSYFWGRSTGLSGKTLAAGGYPLSIFRFGAHAGDTCATDDECSSRWCTDGRCCNVRCVGDCAACSVDAGADSDGVCKVFGSGSLGSPSCGTSVCNGTSLDCTPCTADPECGTGRYCAEGSTCQALLDPGAACSGVPAADCGQTACHACSTGFCADGVCCNQVCDGACEACVSALTALADGECQAIPADQDPEGECAPGGGCGADGWCDGARGCRANAKPGTSCGATTCEDATVTGQICNGSGTCNPDTSPCGAYRCAGDACATSCVTSGDCVSGAYCVQGGTCAPRKANGASCLDGDECTSTHCVDNRCCASECAGACEACAVGAGVATDGTCGPLGLSHSCGENLFCSGVASDCVGCASDAQCPEGRYCAPDGACLEQKALGAACDVAASADCKVADCRVCDSDHCVDGVCCNRECSASEACSKESKTSGDSGTCGEATFAADGEPCVTSDTCTSGQCEDLVCCDRACSPSEACTTQLKVDGEDGSCGPAKQARIGQPCSDESTCSSGFCFDGVCCDRSCSGLCEACTESIRGAGSDGECGPVRAGTDPEEDCLDDGAPACGQNGYCDGEGACQDYESKTECEPESCRKDDACASGHCVDGICCDRECDADEACLGSEKVDGIDGTCGPAKDATLGNPCKASSDCTSGFCVDGYCCGEACDGPCRACSAKLKGSGKDGVCGAIALGTDPEQECEDNAACPETPTCNGSGRCQCQPAEALGAACAEDGVTLVLDPSTGAELACTPFRCLESVCLDRCETGADCAPGYRCDAAGQCATNHPASPTSESGCGCRSSSSDSGAGAWYLALLGAGFARTRRRARPRVITTGPGRSIFTRDPDGNVLEFRESN